MLKAPTVESNLTAHNSTTNLTSTLENKTSNALVLEMFPTVECFSSTHIMHAIFSIIISIILVLLTLMIVFLMFESRKSNTNISSK